jgi:hypothetical protein
MKEVVGDATCSFPVREKLITDQVSTSTLFFDVGIDTTITLKHHFYLVLPCGYSINQTTTSL